MTEAEWLDCDDPRTLLAFVKGSASDRKSRLFACACCRRVLPIMSDQRDSRKTIEFDERDADGLATKNDLHGAAWGKSGQAFTAVQRKAFEAAEQSTDFGASLVAHVLLTSNNEIYATWEKAFEKALRVDNFWLSEAGEMADALMPPAWVESGKSAARAERKSQCEVFRDIFPHSFRPLAVNPRSG